MEIKDFMIQDHQRLDQALEGFVGISTNDPTLKMELFHRVRAVLERHMAWEEEILFPCIERRSGMHMPGPSALVQFQHQRIKALLEKLSIQIANKEKEVDESQKELIALLTLHAEEEKRVLYPWIDLCLCEEDREKVLEKMKQSM